MAKGIPTVEVFAADNKTVIDRGTLQVVDNQVDQTTGTVKLKAEFPNKDLQLWPGQFINVRLLIDTLAQVVVAPTAAVQRGPNGVFVFVVQPDNTVAVRPVTVAQQSETQAVIATGLNEGERVVTTGFARLTAGTDVVVTNAEQVLPPGSEPAAAPRRERRPPGERRDRRSHVSSNVAQL
jgi:multidrug efflux system membrane fusion protein